MPATRRRGDALTLAIREATRAELTERGYAELTFAGVAQRAATSRPVLHRRYATRAQLVADALLDVAFAPAPAPPSGDVRADLMAVLAAVAAQYERIGLENVRLLTAEGDETVLDQFTARTGQLVAELIVPVIRTARDQGHLGPTELPPRVVMLPVSLLRQELLMSSAAPGQDGYAAIVDQIVLPLWRLSSGGRT